MPKKLVVKSFSFRATNYRSGTEVDDAQFSPELLKHLVTTGKLVPAKGEAAAQFKEAQAEVAETASPEARRFISNGTDNH